MNRIVGYARIATSDESTSAQLHALKRARCTLIYEEIGSGHRRDQPELAKCLNTLQAGDTLVVWRLDRLGWSIRDLFEIVQRLDASKIHFRSLTEHFDTTSSQNLFFRIFKAITRVERALISERTKLGLSDARAHGRRGGRKPVLTPQQIRQVATLWATRKKTKNALAEKFGVSVSTIDRIVRPKNLNP